MSRITLHPAKGLNPKMTICASCGKDVGLVLLGNKNKKAICRDCGLVHYGESNFGRKPLRKCKSCKSTNLEFALIEEERLPIEMCDECAEQQKIFNEEIARGGVYFMCEGCKAQGVIKADTDFAKNFREEYDLPAPFPAGVKFIDCPQCEVENEQG